MSADRRDSTMARTNRPRHCAVQNMPMLLSGVGSDAAGNRHAEHSGGDEHSDQCV
jgi:hypothetical protein